jgi:hypothetical protein
LNFVRDLLFCVNIGIDYEGAEEPSTWDAIHVVKTNIDAN